MAVSISSIAAISNARGGLVAPEPRYLLTIAMLLALVMSNAVQGNAQESISREYTIKAGVVGVLRKCVVWPDMSSPAKGEPLKIGILGEDPFVENGVNQLERIIAQDRGNGQEIALMRFDSAKDYEPCHILFVSNNATQLSHEQTVAERLDAAKDAIAGQSVLIVAESDGMTRRGAVANLLYDRSANVIHLELNPDAAARMGLKLAPELLRLKLVRIVRDSKG